MPSLSLLSNTAIYIAFILSCLRPWLAAFEISTSFITITINLLLILGIGQKSNFYVVLGVLYSIFVFIFFSHSILLIFNIFLLAYEVRVINIKKLAILNILSSVVFFIFVIEGLGFGSIQSHTIISHKGGEIYDLGFNNSNTLAMFLTNIVFMLSILTTDFKRFILPAIIGLSSLAILDLTRSRTAFISLAICAFLYLLYGNGVMGKRITRMVSLIPIFLSALLFSIIFIFNNIPGLDLLTSGRLHIFKYWFDQMGAMQYLFGINLDEAGALDGSYFLFVLYGGLPTLFVFLYFFQKNLWENYKYYTRYVPFIVGMLVYGITESNLVVLSGMCIIFWRLTVFNTPHHTVPKYENCLCL